MLGCDGQVDGLPAALERITADAMADIRDRDAGASARAARFHTAAQIGRGRAGGPPRRSSTGLIYAAHSHVLIAPPKVGKSTLSFDWCRAITSGDPWAGRETCSPGPSST